MQRIVILFLLLCVSCSQKTPLTHFQGVAHTHSYHMQIGHFLTSKEKETVITLFDETFETIDLYFNHWNPYSELSLINSLPVGEPYSLSNELLLLLQKAKTLTSLTAGHFDPTYGPLISRVKEALKTHSPLPALEDLPCGWETFELTGNTIIRLHPEAAIDLDGLLKGYALDCIGEKLHALGYINFFLEWGGDIKASGKHPSGRPWQVFLPHTKTTLSLTGALATSGIEEQSAQVQGGLISHFVIPNIKNTTPIFKTIAVQGPSCLIADALATALMTFPTTEALEEFLTSRKEGLDLYTIWFETRLN